MAKKYYNSDSGMINNDYSATANLPQGVVMKKYPKTPVMGRSELNDTIRGIDYQIGKDVNGKDIKKSVMPEKY